ncbi:MAG: hypothetical protein GTO46_01285, partial [Gemmatimonadetes bacterium]|nr:hypothetical protein [Gemmatimonadota bacterium]NIO30431.1 hypothetical protein [Gemmatimonadota bacterium]
EERDPDVTVDFFEQSIRRPLTYVLIPPRALRSWLGNKVEAYNPTAEDDVTASTWFRHRNSRQRLTIAEVARGPAHGVPPDTSGPWTVIGAKVRGITPGYMIRDAAGNVYLIKFDPPDYEELMTAAEAITSRFFYAAGYMAPAAYIVELDPAKARAAESLAFEDRLGRVHAINDDDLQEMLAGLAVRPDGRIRAVASQIMPGGIGPFSFEGTRDDDPADTIPHEHLRELRGMYVMAAWLNHLDTKQQNTLDTVVEEDGQLWVRHCLIDFGSSLGSAGIAPNVPRDGAEFDFDLGAISARLFTGGIYTGSWERYSHQLEHASIGFYSTDLFDPGSWKSNYPNPAFQNRTTRDGYWGAKLVASFDDEQIRAVVATGRLSDPAAEAALVQAIIGRRDLTVEYWYSRVTPLEGPSIAGSSAAPVLTFRDLAVAEGVVPVNERRYEMRFTFPAAGIELEDEVAPQISDGGAGELELPPVPTASDFWQDLHARPVEKRLARLELRAIPQADSPRPRSVRIYLLPVRESGYRIVGRAY